MKKKFVFVFIILLSFSVIAYGDSKNGWEEPLDRADLVLFSSHADDEHLFFAGVLPYCAANGIKAQVVYMYNHDGNPVRNDERLSGLFAVGINNMPVIGPFPDLYSETLEGALKVYGNLGFTEEQFVNFYVENLRRFKPLVAVGHDIKGEYGHGGHILCARALIKAVELAADPDHHHESALKYGVWDTPKTYLHLFGERKITIKIDEPLEFFDGKTAFQVSQYGFSFHKSQHWTYFNAWLNGTAGAPITSSAGIKSHNPALYGLFRTTVGDDAAGAFDFFQNVTLIKDIAEEPEEPDEPDEPDEPEIEEIIIDSQKPGTIDEQGESNNHTPALSAVILSVTGAALILFLLIIMMRRKK